MKPAIRALPWVPFALGLIFWPVGRAAAQAPTPRGAARQVATLPTRPSEQPAYVPPGFELTPQQAARLDQILNFWEHRSGKIDTFECKFRRWEYNPNFVRPETPNEPFTVADGALKYAQPDKGLFRVDKLEVYALPRRPDGTEIPGGKPFYEPRESHEHWICDGRKTIEFVPRAKQVIETPLPPDQQGKAISDGPLPFLFGAKAETLKQRYWIRELQPEPGKKEYWLQIKPKTREDAQNFAKAEIIIDSKEYLPSALRMYVGNERKSFVFYDRKVNHITAQVSRLFNQEFFEPKTPSGWQRVEQPY